MTEKTGRREFLAVAAGAPIAIAELHGHSGFPAATARKEGDVPEPMPAEPTMFYVWRFCFSAEDYIPIAAFSTRGQAEASLAGHAGAAKKKGYTFSGAVLELTWREFMERAVDVRLKELAGPIRAIAAMS